MNRPVSETMRPRLAVVPTDAQALWRNVAGAQATFNRAPTPANAEALADAFERFHRAYLADPAEIIRARIRACDKINQVLRRRA